MTDTTIDTTPHTLYTDQLLSYRDVMRLCKRSRAQAYKIMDRLPKVREGRSALVWLSDLNSYVQSLPTEQPRL